MADRPGLLREAIRRPLPLETFGRTPVRRGETFALPASLPVRVRAGREPVRVIRCLGPAIQ